MIHVYIKLDFERYMSIKMWILSDSVARQSFAGRLSAVRQPFAGDFTRRSSAASQLFGGCRLFVGCSSVVRLLFVGYVSVVCQSFVGCSSVVRWSFVRYLADQTNYTLAAKDPKQRDLRASAGWTLYT